MYFAYPSGIVFGGFMYYLGKSGLIEDIYKNKQHPSHKKHLQEEQKKQNSNKTQNIQAPSEITKNQVLTNTFTAEAITPIIRNIQLNPRCNIIYSTLHKGPLSVHQYLDLSTIEGNASRAPNFHIDQNIKPEKFAVKDEYYRRTGAYRLLNINRGHMAAASNFSSSQQLKNSTFSFANVIPQNGSNNGGIWNTFQRYCRTLLKQKKCDTIQIISGPIYNSNIPYQVANKPDNPQQIRTQKQNDYGIYRNQSLMLMKNGTIIPPKLYKIIKCNTSTNQSYASGFTFLNAKTEDNRRRLVQFQESIQEIQNQTGLVFNFKDKLNGKLTQYDLEALSNTKYKIDDKFYNQLFLNAKSTQQMNSVLRRAYQQQINLNQTKKSSQQKILQQGRLQLAQINSSQQSQCKKLTQYLQLHKNLFYLGSENDRINQLSKNVQQSIKPAIINCRKVASIQQQNRINWKANYRSKRYTYPFSQLIKQQFPGQRVDSNKSSQKSNVSQNVKQ